MQHNEEEAAQQTAQDKEEDEVKLPRMPKGPLDGDMMTKAINSLETYYPQKSNEETLPPRSFASQRDSPWP